MKKINLKEVLILVGATAVIVGAGIIMWRFLFPAPSASTQPATQKNTTISTEIDQNTLKKIDSLSDYGQPNLDNIGKSDLFAN